MSVIIKNYMELYVENELDTVLNGIDVCNCERCKLDITAIALNNLPTKYVVSTKGNVYAKLESLQNQYDVDVISAITRAAKIVKENPKHNQDE